MGRIKKAVQLTENPHLNLYELETQDRKGHPGRYYVASRAKHTEDLELVRKQQKPDGVIIYSLYGEKKDKVVLVRQYRYPYAETTLEIPAGKMDRGPENAEEAGRRELSEETGLTAGQMISMGEIWPSPGFMDERLYLYCAKELAQGACHPDADEFVEIVRMPFEELCQRVASGEIHDAKTVAAVGKMLIMGL